MPKHLGGLGLYKTHEMFFSMLAGLLWRFSRNTSTLWAKVLKVKYTQHKHTGTYQVKSTDSYVWKSMIKAHGLFQARFSWKIGDGSTINLWNDNWLPNNNCLCQSIQGPFNQMEEELKVSAIISNHSWSLDSLSFTLPPIVIDQTHHTYIPFSTCSPDYSFWN